MKVLFLAGDDEKEIWASLYIDKEIITGFWVPTDDQEDDDIPTVTIIYPSLGPVTIQRTKELEEFLLKKFK